MSNIKLIYPSEEGDVVEVITLELAMKQEVARAAYSNYVFSNDEDILRNLLCCPCTTRTNEPVGKKVTPRSNTNL